MTFEGDLALLSTFAGDKALLSLPRERDLFLIVNLRHFYDLPRCLLWAEP